MRNRYIVENLCPRQNVVHALEIQPESCWPGAWRVSLGETRIELTGTEGPSLLGEAFSAQIARRARELGGVNPSAIFLDCGAYCNDRYLLWRWQLHRAFASIVGFIAELVHESDPGMYSVQHPRNEGGYSSAALFVADADGRFVRATTVDARMQRMRSSVGPSLYVATHDPRGAVECPHFVRLTALRVRQWFPETVRIQLQAPRGTDFQIAGRLRDRLGSAVGIECKLVA